MPPADISGVLVPTLNKYGRMLTKIVDPVPQFLEVATRTNEWVLDVGAAYGVNTLAALEAGGKVVANDLDSRHLEILTSKVSPEHRNNLRTVCGAFPDVDFDGQKFSAILACRVLHFLDGPTLERAAKVMFDLLLPGGIAYVRTMTPFLGVSAKVREQYEQRKIQGDRFPGFVQDVKAFISDPDERSAVEGQAHFLDTEVLSRTFSEAGFIIDRCEFVAVMIEPFHLDGREAVILVARKPG
jgi:SAM-dependent methyltransferase